MGTLCTVCNCSVKLQLFQKCEVESIFSPQTVSPLAESIFVMATTVSPSLEQGCMRYKTLGSGAWLQV